MVTIRCLAFSPPVDSKELAVDPDEACVTHVLFDQGTTASLSRGWDLCKLCAELTELESHFILQITYRFLLSQFFKKMQCKWSTSSQFWGAYDM